MTLTHVVCCDHIGFPTTTRIILLASPQQKTPWPVFQDGRCNTSPILLILQCYHCLFQKKFIPYAPHLAITIWFQVLFHTPTGVLFSFPSRYFYTIGLETYLELGVDASHIQTRYPTDPTQEQRQKGLKRKIIYGTITLYGSKIPNKIQQPPHKSPKKI